MTQRVPDDDLEAILALHREQGAPVDQALVESLAAKVDDVVRLQVQRELALRRTPPPPAVRKPGQLALAIVSLALGIPLTAIAGGLGGLLGIVIAWVGIAIVNIVYGEMWPGRDERR